MHGSRHSESDVAELSDELAATGDGAVRHLLVSGPAMTGKRAQVERLLPKAGETVIWVSVTDPATQVRSDVEHPDLRIVDAVSRQTGATVTDDERTWYAASPADLTGLGMKVSEALTDEGCERPVLFLDNVSTLLLYAELERVYRFLHVVNARIDALDGRSIQLFHTDGTEDKDEATLRQLFSHVLEMRRREETMEYRYSGRDLSGTEWQEVG